MKVSIIITTKNEGKNIQACLESIQQQNFPAKDIEIIVVDNNSSDRTKEIAERYTKKVFNKGPERSAQRNYGVQKCNGEWILYLDADMTLHPDVIRDALIAVNRDEKLIALYIREVVVGESFFAKVRRFERSFYDATVIDCVRVIRKDVFEKVGGFDTTMSGPEDWDFDKKIRAIGKTSLLTTPVYHNESEVTLTRYLKKKAYYSQSFATYIRKWGVDDPDVKKQLSPWYRYVGVFMENNRWKKVVAHPILTIAMLTLRLLVGLTYLKVKGLGS
ncbi:MAG: PGL/p-HBAD biosynthesis glycosyltransferase [Microgenomates bacterium OLB22]|nr:MAG: PGL/p-HBAD biosynthesis glycosyltransferase [Microgenomates bacterium OLB22]